MRRVINQAVLIMRVENCAREWRENCHWKLKTKSLALNIPFRNQIMTRKQPSHEATALRRVKFQYVSNGFASFHLEK